MLFFPFFFDNLLWVVENSVKFYRFGGGSDNLGFLSRLKIYKSGIFQLIAGYSTKVVCSLNSIAWRSAVPDFVVEHRCLV